MKSFSPLLAAFSAAALLLSTGPNGLAGTSPPRAPSMFQTPGAHEFADSVIRVNATSQSYDFFRPWSKKNPGTKRGLGAVVDENRVLVTAELVADHTYIEFERPATGERVPAELEFVDYEANLALLSAMAPEFFANARPLRLQDTARVGDEVSILQLEPTGEVADTTARISTITNSSYLIDDAAMLIFRLTAPIQQREGSFVLPVVDDGKLLGLLMRYDSRNQTADLIPPPVIGRFLESAEVGELRAFPRAGITFASLRDPQLRNYLGLGDNGGILITKVEPGGAAEEAGIQPNDVVLSIDGTRIDSDGNFSHPDFGRISLSYLISIEKVDGEEVDLEVFRDGEVLDISMPLHRRDPTSRSVPSYLFDQQPRFFVYGGFVFQELTRPYLQEWGGDWRGSAPQRLVMADLLQDELRPDGERVVILTGVLPTAATIGYEGLSNHIVEKVDGVPVSSLEELRDILTSPRQPIHSIQIEDEPGLVFLDSRRMEEAEQALRTRYGVTQLYFFGKEAEEKEPDDS